MSSIDVEQLTCAANCQLSNTLFSAIMNVDKSSNTVRFIHEGKMEERSLAAASLLVCELRLAYEKKICVALAKTKKIVENHKKRKAEKEAEDEPAKKKAKTSKKRNEKSAGHYFPDVYAAHLKLCDLNTLVGSQLLAEVYKPANEELARAAFGATSDYGLPVYYKPAENYFIMADLVKNKQKNTNTGETVHLGKIKTTGPVAVALPSEDANWNAIICDELVGREFNSPHALCSSDVAHLAGAPKSSHNPNGWEVLFLAEPVIITWPVGFIEEGKVHQWTLPRFLPFTHLREIHLNTFGLPQVSYKKKDGTVVNLPADSAEDIARKRKELNAKFGIEVVAEVAKPVEEQDPYGNGRSVPSTPGSELPALVAAVEEELENSQDQDSMSEN